MSYHDQHVQSFQCCSAASSAQTLLSPFLPIPLKKTCYTPILLSIWPRALGRSGAGDGNRTHVTSLEGWGSTIELHPHVQNHQAIPPNLSTHFHPPPGGGGWIRTNVGVRQRVYSPSPLATRAPLRKRHRQAEIFVCGTYKK
jgi:hypothetical protein